MTCSASTTWNRAAIASSDTPDRQQEHVAGGLVGVDEGRRSAASGTVEEQRHGGEGTRQPTVPIATNRARAAGFRLVADGPSARPARTVAAWLKSDVHHEGQARQLDRDAVRRQLDRRRSSPS